jgi:hypothetical protein
MSTRGSAQLKGRISLLGQTLGPYLSQRQGPRPWRCFTNDRRDRIASARPAPNTGHRPNMDAEHRPKPPARAGTIRARRQRAVDRAGSMPAPGPEHSPAGSRPCRMRPPRRPPPHCHAERRTALLSNLHTVLADCRRARAHSPLLRRCSAELAIGPSMKTARLPGRLSPSERPPKRPVRQFRRPRPKLERGPCVMRSSSCFHALSITRQIRPAQPVQLIQRRQHFGQRNWSGRAE